MTDLIIKHGDTRDWSITLSDADGVRFDLTDSSVQFRLKTQEDSPVTFFSRNTDGTGSDYISIDSPASSGIITITPTVSDWSSVSDYGSHVGEVFVVDANGRTNLFRDLDVDIQRRLKHPNFTVETTPVVTTLVLGSEGRITETDVVTDWTTAALVESTWTIAVAETTDLDPENVTYESNDTSILTVNSSGVVSWVSNGYTYVTASIGSIGVNVTTWFDINDVIYTIQFVPVNRSGGTTTYELVNWVSGSLAEHADSSVDALIAGKNAATHQPVFTSQDHTTPTYVRNTNCWAHGLDLTGWSPWNTRSAAWGLVAITEDCICLPYHLLWQGDTQFIRIGDTVRFVANDNTVVDRTITDTRRILAEDLAVCSLSSALPSSIKPMPITPANIIDYLPHMVYSSYGLRMAGFTGDAQEKALVRDIVYVEANSIGGCKTYTATETTRALFSENVVSGDSGNPCGMVVNGELVFLGPMVSGSLMAYSIGLHTCLDEIQTAMDEMGCVGTLTYVDLSGFPTY